MQTRLGSLIEVLTGTFTGMIGSWLICYVSFRYIPELALATTVSTIGCTVWSLVRGYCVRRWFTTRALRSLPQHPIAPAQHT